MTKLVLLCGARKRRRKYLTTTLGAGTPLLLQEEAIGEGWALHLAGWSWVAPRLQLLSEPWLLLCFQTFCPWLSPSDD